MTPSNDARRRLVEAMGLGPSWVRRAPRVLVDDVVDGDPVARDARIRHIADLAWEPLSVDVAGCVACRLSRSRTQAVFGTGARDPDWLVVGAAPGFEEDARGEPFIGQAGRLLDAMLGSVGLSRERNVFITDIVKCRPPADRDPAADEGGTCHPYLARQIVLLAPKMILAVGAVAVASLLGTDEPLDRLRGRRHVLTIGGRDIPLVVTHHPADLLRSGEDKATAWADLCFARDLSRQIGTTSPQ